MSGDYRVQLVGPVMVRLVAAIPQVQQMLGAPVVVGGLAVACRLGRAHRVTDDLDTLRRRQPGDPSGLEVLRAAGASGINEVGGLIATNRGDVRVDILDAGPLDLDRDFTDPTDRLEALAHHWALQTATPVLLTASALEPGASPRSPDVVEASALVARPGPLVAMKLKASVDRGAAKRATDLLDIVRLVTDPATADQVLTELEGADAQLRCDAAMHAELQFRTNGLATRRLLSELRQPGLDDDLVDAAAAFLGGALR